MIRVLLVVALLTAVGIAAVQLRREMAASSNRLQRLHRQRVLCDHALWSRQVELANLRVPARVRERVERMGLPVNAPRVIRGDSASQEARLSHGVVRTED